MLKKFFQAVALAAAVLSSVPALSAEEYAADVRVYYGDLDLSAPADVERLDRRLDRAAKAACPSDNGVREMSQLRVIALCRAAKAAEIAPRRQAVIAAAASRNTTFAVAR